MKASTVKLMFAFQAFTLAIVLAIGYVVWLNNSGINRTINVTRYTQHSLKTTFEFMDEVNAKKIAAEEARQPLPEGSVAPGFTLADENGQNVSLADFQGGKTLLVFSREGCQYCEKYYPVLNDFQAQNDSINVVILQIGATPDENKAYKELFNIDVPLLSASRAELLAYKVQGTPTSILIDEEGGVLGTEVVSGLEALNDFVGSASRHVAK